MAYVQFFMIFLTSMNRFTMIFWSSTYEKVIQIALTLLLFHLNQTHSFLNSSNIQAWNRVFKYIVVFLIILPIPFTWTILVSSTYYIHTESLDCYTVSTSVVSVRGQKIKIRILSPESWIPLQPTVTIFCYCHYHDSHYQCCIVLSFILHDLQDISCWKKFTFCQWISIFGSVGSWCEYGKFFSKVHIMNATSLSLLLFFQTINRLVVNDNNKNSLWSQIAVTLLPYVSDGLTLIHPWLFLAFSTKVYFFNYICIYFNNFRLDDVSCWCTFRNMPR